MQGFKAFQASKVVSRWHRLGRVEFHSGYMALAEKPVQYLSTVSIVGSDPSKEVLISNAVERKAARPSCSSVARDERRRGALLYLLSVGTFP